RFRVRPQPGHLAALPNPGQLATETMGEHDRCWHEFRRLITGVAEHLALVTGALLGCFFTAHFARVDALGDVVGLIGDDRAHENFLGMKNVVLMDVADLAHTTPHAPKDQENRSQAYAPEPIA